MNVDRILLLCLTLVLLCLLYKHHRFRLRWLWQRTKDHLPRNWKPKSARDCPGCQTGISPVSLPDPASVVPWSERKSNRGPKKSVDTTGYACPHSQCHYFGITDPAIHALVGYGWIDQAQTIRRLCCQVCCKTFSARKDTPPY